MLDLSTPKAPFDIALPYGLAVTVRPLTTAGMAAAQAAACRSVEAIERQARERTEAGLALDRLPDFAAEGERDGFYQAQLIRELAVRHITGQTGVELKAAPRPWAVLRSSRSARYCCRKFVSCMHFTGSATRPTDAPAEAREGSSAGLTRPFGGKDDPSGQVLPAWQWRASGRHCCTGATGRDLCPELRCSHWPAGRLTRDRSHRRKSCAADPRDLQTMRQRTGP
jgi:hypothetical protein